jgi:hypothetical protein
MADVPGIEKGVHIMNGGNYLEVELNAVPTAVDWNNDGAKDLVIGQLIEGYIWLFLNKGTDFNPVFNGGDLIHSNGEPISVSCC